MTKKTTTTIIRDPFWCPFLPHSSSSCCVHHILSFFNYNWNALGPEFLQSSGSVAEELLILLLQLAICHADVFAVKISLCMGDLNPHLICGSLGQPESTPQTAYDRCSCFCRAHDCNRPTDRQIHHATPSVKIGRIYKVVRHGLIVSCAIM